MKLFVDTSAWVALNDGKDPWAGKALDFMQDLPPNTRFVTSNLVFTEAVTLLASHCGQQAAVEFGTAFFRREMLEDVHYSDEWLERAALEVLRRFRDKDLSFTDAATIVLVKMEALDGVFGFDSDFVRCGVPLYPRPAA